MNQTAQDGLDVLTAQQRLQRESARAKVGYVSPGAYTCNGSPSGCERERFGGCVYHEELESAQQLPALLQLEATVTEVNRYVHLPHLMTVRFGSGEYVGQARVSAPSDAKVGDRYVCVLSRVNFGGVE